MGLGASPHFLLRGARTSLATWGWRCFRHQAYAAMRERDEANSRRERQLQEAEAEEGRRTDALRAAVAAQEELRRESEARVQSGMQRAQVVRHENKIAPCRHLSPG